MFRNKLGKEEVEMLFIAANEMIRMNDEGELYAYVAKYLADIYPDTVVIIMKMLPWEETSNKAELVQIEGVRDSFISKAANLIGYKPQGQIFDIFEKDIALWKTNKLILNKEGFEEFFGDKINPSISRSLEKLIQLNKIYSIGLQDQDELFALIHFYTRKTQEIESPVFLETFVQQSSIIISQLKSRHALQKSEKKLIRLSESLTALSKTKTLKDAYNYVTMTMHDAYPDSIIMYTALDEASKMYTISSFAGVDQKQLDKINALADSQWLDKKFDMNEHRHQLLRKGVLIQLEGGFVSFEGPEFTDETAEAIHKSLNIKRVYSIGLLLDDQLIGAIYIAICRDYQYPEKRFVETFAKQVATIIAIIESRQALMENEAKLRKLNADKDRFMQVLAHDLRSPFNSILGYSNLLVRNAEKYDCNKVREIATMLSKTSTQSYELLEDILRWASAGTGNLEIKNEPIVLNQFIDELLEILEAQAAPKNIVLEPSYSKNPTIISDPDMLRTAIRNLISNAIKFSYQGGKIIVKTGVDAENNIMISVIDQGIGMSEEELNALWDPTKKTYKQGTENESGTGFGLVICKDFITALNGNISVESRPKKGSTFRITLPVK